jgi:beta-lactamase superfamily II metal-dependent hydrolase
MAEQAVAVDLVRVKDAKGHHVRTLILGARVDVLERTPDEVKIALVDFVEHRDGTIEPVQAEGFIRKPSAASGLTLDDVLVPPAESDVLRLDFVDVQQGDGAVIETPSGQVVLVDGGDNQLFARYLASRFRDTTEAAPKEIDAIVVSHGDADHFAGLTQIHVSEKNRQPKKQLFIHPRRVFHNGLVKRPTSVPTDSALGASQKVGERTIITGLEEDLLSVPDREMNGPFLAWKRALEAFDARGPISFRRLEKGDDAAFDFLDDGLKVQVLGPMPTMLDGVTGLVFLGAPRKGPRVGHPSTTATTFSGKSVSHTINGHSIVLRLTYGDWRVLYAGDLNEQAEAELLRAHHAGEIDLEAEVLKVPHHGSAEFSGEFLAAVRPLVSVVSSGDESARKEFIHPRATLMSALGKHARDGESLVFVTELVAFFEVEGWVGPEQHPPLPPPELAVHDKKTLRKETTPFFAFSRKAFGLVQVRTDGKRLLVCTDSARLELKEAYAYEMQDGKPVAVPVRQV